MNKEYKVLKNKINKLKRSETVKAKKKEWKNKLDQLFDIARAIAMKDMCIAEDRAFLIAQREQGRREKMSNVNKHLAEKEKKQMRKNRIFKRLEIERSAH